VAIWCVLKKIGNVLGVCEAPIHKNFLDSLLVWLNPDIKEVAPMPTDRGCLALCNHVNWSDFVIDICLVENGVYVSRNLLKFIFFPGSILRQLLFGDCIFFQRGGKSAHSKSHLYKQVEEKCLNENRCIIVYVEGTRNPKKQKLPLKVGLLKLAYEKKIPVFVSMTTDKTSIFDETNFIVTFRVPIINKKSPIIDPLQFSDLSSFLAQVQSHWDSLWSQLILSPPKSEYPTLHSLPSVCGRNKKKLIRQNDSSLDI